MYSGLTIWVLITRIYNCLLFAHREKKASEKEYSWIVIGLTRYDEEAKYVTMSSKGLQPFCFSRISIIFLVSPSRYSGIICCLTQF